MLSRENLHAIINNVAGKLNTYLKNHSHEILSENQLRAGYESGFYDERNQYVPKRYKYRHYHQCADGNYIAMKSDIDHRNTSLTMERMANIYDIVGKLNKQLVLLPKAKPEDFNSQINSIRNMLQIGKMENARLSTKYYKIHHSYQDGRLLKQNIFSSRWNATWFKSRANRALENSLDTLDNFEKKFKAKDSPPKYNF